MDLFQHWIMTETGLSDDDRKRIMDEWIGPLSTERRLPPEDAWAPAWWHGDEEATVTSRMATMTLDAARNRR